MSRDSYNRLRRNTKYLETQFAHFSLPEGNFNQWHDYEKNITRSRCSAGIVLLFHC
ncbi:protein of unknown function [Enterobacter cancerogenus]|nr:protein of unknown function [Enterobacter cancerogenus]